MGSGSSKTRRIEGNDGSSTSSFSSSSSRRKRNGMFGTACLGSSSRAYNSSDDDDDDNVDDEQVSDNCHQARRAIMQQAVSESDDGKVELYQTMKVDGSDNMPGVSSNVELGEWAHASDADNMLRPDGSSSQDFSSRSVNHSSRFLSHFSFIPGSVSFRLNRAASVGSSRACPSSPTSFAASSCEEDVHMHGNRPRGFIDNVNSPSLSNRSIRGCIGDSSVNVRRNTLTSMLSRSLRDNQVISGQDLVESDSERIRSGLCLPSLGNSSGLENAGRRVGDHRNGSREQDRNVRFSRTLSVGRLRDRVLRRSSFSDLNLSSLQQEGSTTSDGNSVNSLMSSPYPMPSMHNRYNASQSSDVETSHTGNARQQDLLEHRSTFLERRRRIRSQVRALQRLGSRFENLSGHERYCILSGQHRTGQCSCRITSRETNSNADGGARASISRIVMLAEALFEVLDEIHQQSVVLSSRPSVSSIGSLPAPNEVVESLPVRIYSKPSKLQSEEVVQCYICLVEYEEGDDLRILPCHHEFHQKCVDKWLKDIHRVCPLCRGDICKSDSLPVES